MADTTPSTPSEPVSAASAAIGASPSASAPATRSALPKILLVLVALIAVVVVGTVMFGGSALNGIVRRAVEHVGTQTTGEQTTLASAKIGLTSGSANLGGLRIANPEGFKADKFMSLGETDVALNIQSLRGDVIEVNHVKLSDIEVNLEGTPGSMNYNKILDHIKAQSGEPKPDQPAQKFRIKTVELKNVKANVKVGMMPETTVQFDNLVINNLGDEGLTASELTQVVVQVVLEGIASKGGGVLPADLMNDLGSSLGGLRDLGLEGLDEIGGQLENIGKEAGDAAKGIIGDILGGGKKDGK